MNNKKCITWINRGLDYEDWRDSLEQDYPDRTEVERTRFMVCLFVLMLFLLQVFFGFCCAC